MQKIFTKEKIANFKRILDESSNIVIVSHTNPDGDAIGSTSAVKILLKKLYPDKNISAVVPNQYPVFLNWIGRGADIKAYNDDKENLSKTVSNSDLIIVLDMNCLDRTDNLKDIILSNHTSKCVHIDHHITPKVPAQITFHDECASSTCFLVCMLIKEMGLWDIVDSEIASSLYTGIITDTGGFSYSYLTKELFLIAGELVSKGADPVKIHQNIFDNLTENCLRLKGYLTNNKMVLIKQHNAAYITLNKKEKNKFKYQIGDSEGIVNIPMSINGITISAFFMESDGYIKVSLRSQGEMVNVDKMAKKWFNGGGHFNASGGKYFGNMDEAVKTYLKALDEND